MSNAATPKNFAGLPDGMVKAPAADRAYTEFKIPVDRLGAEFGTLGFSDADRSFGITEITPSQEKRAASMAGTNMDFHSMQTEQHKIVIYRIGADTSKPDYDRVTAWYKAIGPRGRKTFEVCWGKINGIEQSEGEVVARAGQPKRG